jgi:hypothetical protein
MFLNILSLKSSQSAALFSKQALAISKKEKKIYLGFIEVRAFLVFLKGFSLF